MTVLLVNDEELVLNFLSISVSLQRVYQGAYVVVLHALPRRTTIRCISLAFVTAPAGEKSNARLTSRLAVPDTAVRFLVVQTLRSRSFAADASLSGSQSVLSSPGRIVSVDRPWYELPTLVGANLSFNKNLVRLSAAGIFHDGERDLEVATVLDATPLLPSTPTLFKLGWNSTGRLAIGVTSLLANAFSVTLGVHAMQGEEMRFGLELKV